MDKWGIIIFILGVIAYYGFKKKPFFAFVSGIGAGILIGAIWAYFIMTSIFS